MERAVVIQLARMGDLLQSIPAISAIKAERPGQTLDLLCPTHLSPLGRLVPGIGKTVEWDGAAWHRRAQATEEALHPRLIQEAARHIHSLAPELYACAYVLNHHPRALYAGSLLAKTTRGPRLHGPLGDELSPWASYVREVANTRTGRRVHLADAFCGLCGVRPPGRPPAIEVPICVLPSELEPIGKQGGPWIGLVVGAGDAERLVPLEIWRQVVTMFLRMAPRGRVVLMGQEQERAQHIQDGLSPSLLGRIWDLTARTSIPELAAILARCDSVIGADTGPLHLAAAVGVRAIGWYFARACVHETGPYGTQHVVWQATTSDDREHDSRLIQPQAWPIEETVAVLEGHQARPLAEWTAWSSHCDQWGAYYTEAGHPPTPPPMREELWRELEPALR